MQIEQDNFIPDDGTKNKKIMTIIIALIAILIIGIMAVIFVMITMIDNKLSVVIDGQKVNINEDTFIFTDDR